MYIWLTNVYVDSLVQPPDCINALKSFASWHKERMYSLKRQPSEAAVGWHRGQQRWGTQAAAGRQEHPYGAGRRAASRLVWSDEHLRALPLSWNSLWQTSQPQVRQQLRRLLLPPADTPLRAANAARPGEESREQRSNDQCSRQQRRTQRTLTPSDALSTRAGMKTDSSLSNDIAVHFFIAILIAIYRVYTVNPGPDGTSHWECRRNWESAVDAPDALGHTACPVLRLFVGPQRGPGALCTGSVCWVISQHGEQTPGQEGAHFSQGSAEGRLSRDPDLVLTREIHNTNLPFKISCNYADKGENVSFQTFVASVTNWNVN